MFEHLRGDVRQLSEIKGRGPKAPLKLVIESALFDNGFQAVVLHRLANWLKVHRIPALGPLVGRISQALTGVEIAPAAEIGPGLVISHGRGIVIGQWAKIGRNCLLHHQVTLGARDVGRIDGMPRIGDGVLIGAGAKLIGPIEVGDHAVVGPNTFVTTDVPAGGRALAPKAVIQGPRAPAGPGTFERENEGASGPGGAQESA